MDKKKRISRRQFLQMMPIMLLAPFVKTPQTGRQLYQAASIPDAEIVPPANVIIILFDALSAQHLNIYGYPRETATNIAKFAQRATIYHNHHSAGNFTTPSTASFLTGVYPWTHRALAYGNRVNIEKTPDHVFNLLKDVYFQVAYTQNLYADALLRQFSAPLDRYIPLSSFSLAGNTFYDKLTQKDSYYALSSFDDFLFDQDETSGSLFLSTINQLVSTYNLRRAESKYGNQYPSGFPKQPKTNLVFTIDRTIDGVIAALDKWQAPFFSYLHFIPPHAPYRPRRDYQELFKDVWEPVEKPIHPLSKGTPQQNLNKARLEYDQFIANLDTEVGRLFDHLEKSGRLDDSYVIFTSDHGEMFERGMLGHSTRLMYEPVLHVPLLISAPGQKERKDIYAQTSTVDLLPSLLHIAGLPVPDWCDGAVLPGLGGKEDDSRLVFSVEAKSNSAFEPLQKASFALYQGDFKLIHYMGYSGAKNPFEFYNLKDDPEELYDLYATHPQAKQMQTILEEKLREVNLPFQG